MKLKADSTEQKLRGAYYTPLPLAEMMVGLFSEQTSIHRILEPSCGDGVFLDAFIRSQLNGYAHEVIAIEIDEAEADKTQKRRHHQYV